MCWEDARTKLGQRISKAAPSGSILSSLPVLSSLFFHSFPLQGKGSTFKPLVLEIAVDSFYSPWRTWQDCGPIISRIFIIIRLTWIKVFSSTLTDCEVMKKVSDVTMVETIAACRQQFISLSPTSCVEKTSTWQRMSREKARVVWAWKKKKGNEHSMQTNINKTDGRQAGGEKRKGGQS